MKTSPFHLIRRGLGALAVTVLIACQSSCSWSLSGTASQFQDDSDIKASYQQIRLRMRSLVDPMGGEIERAADRIITSTSSPSEQRAAIEWKAQAVPAIRESLFQPAALTALLDTWVLLYQMEDYYQSGDGAKELGSSAPIAVATCRKMEDDYHQVVASFTHSGDISEGRAFAKDWASKHPIQGSISHRESTLTRSNEINLPDKFTASEAIADITLTVDDLNRRLEIYSDQAIRQARWEAQLLTMDLTEQLALDQAMPLAGDAVNQVAALSGSVAEVADSVEDLATTVGTMVPIIDRLAKVAETTPEFVSTERSHAIKAAQDEITRAITVIESERNIALKYVTAERLAALQTLHQTITDERTILTRDLEDISTRVVDHTFTRVVQLVIGLLIALVLILLVGLFIIRRMIAGLLTLRQETAKAD